MPVVNALSSVAASDLVVATSWYERILGPASHPMDQVVEWQLEGGGALQVYLAPERAGRGSSTLIVDDIQRAAADLEAAGIPHTGPVVGPAVDTIMVRDPDGNSIAFAAPKDPRLAR